MGGCGSSRGEDQRNQAEAASGRLEPGEGQPSAAGGSGALHLGDRAGAGDSLPHPGSLAHTRPCNRTASWPLATAKSIFRLPPHPSLLLYGVPSLKISPGPLEYLCGADTRACTWQRTPVPAGDLTAGSSVLAQRGTEHAAALESRCHGKEPCRFKPRFSPPCNGSRCSIYLYGVGRRLPQERRGKVPNVEGMTPPRQRCGDGGGGGGPAGELQVSRG